MPLVYHDPQHWLERAAWARELAEKMTDLEGKSRMVAVAEQYERIADLALDRLKTGAMANVPSARSDLN